MVHLPEPQDKISATPLHSVSFLKGQASDLSEYKHTVWHSWISTRKKGLLTISRAMHEVWSHTYSNFIEQFSSEASGFSSFVATFRLLWLTWYSNYRMGQKKCKSKTCHHILLLVTFINADRISKYVHYRPTLQWTRLKWHDSMFQEKTRITVWWVKMHGLPNGGVRAYRYRPNKTEGKLNWVCEVRMWAPITKQGSGQGRIKWRKWSERHFVTLIFGRPYYRSSLWYSISSVCRLSVCPSSVRL